jgi:DNA polymerase-3 subunit alpha
VTTQFDKDDVEALGLLKMDFLGLRTLTVIDDAVKSIRRSDNPDLDLAEIPFDDPDVYALFSGGDTDGVFQFESSGMKDVLRKVQPQSFLDIAALNALYRPGPMQFIDDYAERKHGRKTITYIFPELEEILGETYGIIVYQEQVMRIAVEIAGFSLAKADTLRKAMGKKQQEIIDREGENFIQGAVSKGHPKDKARQLWNQIVPFAKYGFNKSHSVAYAHVAYVTAYLKTHYLAHFMAAMLTSEVNNTDKLGQYLVRCKQMDLEILPPNINGRGAAARSPWARGRVHGTVGVPPFAAGAFHESEGPGVPRQGGLLRRLRHHPQGHSRQPRTTPRHDRPREGATRARPGFPF